MQKTDHQSPAGIDTPEIFHLQHKGRILKQFHGKRLLDTPSLLEMLEISRISKNPAHTVLNDQI